MNIFLLLQAIQKRPLMYLSQPSFTELMAFIHGFLMGRPEMQSADRRAFDTFCHEWLPEKVKDFPPAGYQAYFHQGRNESEALGHFWKCWMEYQEERSDMQLIADAHFLDGKAGSEEEGCRVQVRVKPVRDEGLSIIRHPEIRWNPAVIFAGNLVLERMPDLHGLLLHVKEISVSGEETGTQKVADLCFAAILNALSS